MDIRAATDGDFGELTSFYAHMCDELGKADFLPEGNRGGFPSEPLIRQSIARGEQFVGVEDGKVVAAYIMNHDADAAYGTARWSVDGARDEVSVLHALRVLPSHSGRGLSKQLVRHAIATARNLGQKSLRLDCIQGNDVPQRMYRSFGFSLVGTAEITYEDIGVPRLFNLYELALQDSSAPPAA